MTVTIVDAPKNNEQSMASGFFITGTGTEVGKTYIAARMAQDLTAAGKRVGVYKPVASGCQVGEGPHLVSDDAARLWEAAGRPLTQEQVCPQKFVAPVAPNVAARLEGRQVDAKLLRTGIEPWLDAFDVVLVEGAGGLMSPISEEDFNADLAADLGFPLVVVAANRLGVINDTLQTLITASVFGEGLEVAGVVLNQVTEADDDASLASNADQLREHLRVPLLGDLSWHGRFSEPVTRWFPSEEANQGG